MVTLPLIRELKRQARKAYAPYSKFQVACCIVAADGHQYFCANVENSSFPLGTCAEAGAISRMVSAGSQEIKDVFLYSAPATNILPCGGCLQRIAEFGSKSTRIYSIKSSKDVDIYRLAELLPRQFELKRKR